MREVTPPPGRAAWEGARTTTPCPGYNDEWKDCQGFGQRCPENLEVQVEIWEGPRMRMPCAFRMVTADKWDSKASSGKRLSSKQEP